MYVVQREARSLMTILLNPVAPRSNSKHSAVRLAAAAAAGWCGGW